MPACHCSSCLKKKESKRKKGCIHGLGSLTLSGCLKTSLFWFWSLQPYLSVALDCLTGQINSLYPMLTNADFFSFLFVIGNLNVQLFLFLSFSLFSDCSWCWALPSTAMIPPNIAACMRNEKLGEACFYLMGHNQTTVCSSINTRCFCAVA